MQTALIKLAKQDWGNVLLHISPLCSFLFTAPSLPAEHTSHRAALARARTTASSIYPLFKSHLLRLDAATPGQQRARAAMILPHPKQLVSHGPRGPLHRE